MTKFRKWDLKSQPSANSGNWTKKNKCLPVIRCDLTQWSRDKIDSFCEDVFKSIVFTGCIWIQILLKYVSTGPINNNTNKPSLVQIMANFGDASHIYVIPSKWVYWNLLTSSCRVMNILDVIPFTWTPPRWLMKSKKCFFTLHGKQVIVIFQYLIRQWISKQLVDYLRNHHMVQTIFPHLHLESVSYSQVFLYVFLHFQADLCCTCTRPMRQGFDRQSWFFFPFSSLDPEK